MGTCFGSDGKDSNSAGRNSKSVSGISASRTESSAGSTGITGVLSNANIDSAQTIDSNFAGDEPYPEGQILEAPNLREFTFSELRRATKNFSQDFVLGEGGFGKVYKGWLEEKTLNPARSGTGMLVAVKKLDSESVQGLEEWQSEVKFLGRLLHPNLVKLFGYCGEGTELLLVYEFMAKGSLENHLFRRGTSGEALSWNLRLKIAIDAARGLAFLHSAERQVIYRDFKASNILLDSNYNAKLSDFGLAKHGPAGGNSHVTTRIMGTFGYAAPEYVATGHLYVKSDVYGFGVVLLEMLTGLRALDTHRPSGQHNLVEWRRPFLSDRRNWKKMMDPRMEGQYSSKGAYRAAQLSHKCISGDPRSRPSMKEVVEELLQIQAMRLPSKQSGDDGKPNNLNPKR